MSRSIQEGLIKIERQLYRYIAEEDKGRISSQERRIYLSRDEYDIFEHSKVSVACGKNCKAALIDYRSRKFFVVFNDSIDEVNENFDFVDDKKIVNGIGISLIYEQSLELKDELSSISLINSFFGLETDTGSKIDILPEVVIDFYQLYCVFEIKGDEETEFIYKEDILRNGLCLKVKNQNRFLNEEIKNSIENLLTLRSSRGILSAIENICDLNSYRHIFLELYRCLEYLYIVVKILDWNEKYGISEDKIVELIFKEELRFIERKSIKNVIEKLNDAVLDKHLANGFGQMEREMDRGKKCEKISEYIYQTRCDIAHFKYMQKDLLNEQEFIEKAVFLVGVLYDIFESLDDSIRGLGEKTDIWNNIYQSS